MELAERGELLAQMRLGAPAHLPPGGKHTCDPGLPIQRPVSVSVVITLIQV
jgi:hypothetical protein